MSGKVSWFVTEAQIEVLRRASCGQALSKVDQHKVPALIERGLLAIGVVPGAESDAVTTLGLALLSHLTQRDMTGTQVLDLAMHNMVAEGGPHAA